MRSYFFLILFLTCSLASALTVLKVPDDTEVYKVTKDKLKDHDETVDRTIKRLGNKTIEFNSFMATEGDIKSAPEIFANFKALPAWALKNINIRPSTGGSYYFQILDIVPDPKEDGLLLGKFYFNLPFFKYHAERTFKLKTTTKDDIITVTGETLPSDDSPIASAEFFIRIFKAEQRPNRMWIYLKSVAVLRNWLLYEAMPEKLLARETGERIQIVLDNYFAEEERLRQKRMSASTSPTPTPKKKSKD